MFISCSLALKCHCVHVVNIYIHMCDSMLVRVVFYISVCILPVGRILSLYFTIQETKKREKKTTVNFKNFLHIKGLGNIVLKQEKKNVIFFLTGLILKVKQQHFSNLKHLCSQHFL